MTLGLDWINDLIRWLASWLPHWDVCEPTHAGVKYRARIFRKGVVTRQIEPGMYWWWPVTTRCYVLPVVRQSVDLPSQSLDTRDGVSILVSCALVYVITDVIKAMTKNHDVNDTIREIGAAAAVHTVVGRTSQQLRKAVSDGAIEAELKEAARRLLRPYGVRITDARFTDCVKHTAIRTEGSGSPVLAYPGEE